MTEEAGLFVEELLWNVYIYVHAHDDDYTCILHYFYTYIYTSNFCGLSPSLALPVARRPA